MNGLKHQIELLERKLDESIESCQCMKTELDDVITERDYLLKSVDLNRQELEKIGKNYNKLQDSFKV